MLRSVICGDISNQYAGVMWLTTVPDGMGKVDKPCQKQDAKVLLNVVCKHSRRKFTKPLTNHKILLFPSGMTSKQLWGATPCAVSASVCKPILLMSKSLTQNMSALKGCACTASCTAATAVAFLLMQACFACANLCGSTPSRLALAIRLSTRSRLTSAGIKTVECPATKGDAQQCWDAILGRQSCVHECQSHSWFETRYSYRPESRA